MDAQCNLYGIRISPARPMPERAAEYRQIVLDLPAANYRRRP
jgi:hypothetical protein